jgi:hypothetical protein
MDTVWGERMLGLAGVSITTTRVFIAGGIVITAKTSAKAIHEVIGEDNQPNGRRLKIGDY